jgi:tetratricopeptide (TPR) repeat protein
MMRGLEDKLALVGLGRLFLAAQLHELAVEACTRALQFDEFLPEALAVRGIGLARLGAGDDAQGDLQYAYSKLPNDFSVRNSLASVEARRGIDALQHGNIADALANLSLAVELQPKDPQSRMFYGEALRRSEKYDQALEHLTLASRYLESSQVGERAFTFGTIGQVLHELNRLRESEDALRASLRLRDESDWVHAELGEVLRMNSPELAIRHLQKAVELNPVNGWAWSSLASTQARLYQHDAALQSINKALSVSPGEAWAHAVKAHILLELDSIPLAIEFAHSALDINPDLRWAHAVLGYALELTHGPNDDAEEAYKAAIEDGRAGHMARARLAECHLARGDLAALE